MCSQNNNGGTRAPPVVNNYVAHTDVQDVVNEAPSSSTANVVRNNYPRRSNEILLQCALSDFCDPEKKHFSKSCILFDGCSQRTYVTTKLSERLQLPCIRTEEILLKTFADKEGRLQLMKVVQLCVKGRNNVDLCFEALVVPFICSRVKFPSLDTILDRYEYLRDLDLAEPPTSAHEVEILLGLDSYFRIVTGKIRRGPPGHPTAVQSIIGWMICGPSQVGDSVDRETMINVISIEDAEESSEESDLKAELQRFWEVDPVVDSEDKMVL